MSKTTWTKETKMGKVIAEDCSRCNGSGNWAPGRVCFKCNGFGYVTTDTAESAYNRKLAHINEVKGIIANEEARLLKARFGKMQVKRTIEERKAQLVTLEKELAVLASKK